MLRLRKRLVLKVFQIIVGFGILLLTLKLSSTIIGNKSESVHNELRKLMVSYDITYNI